MDSKSLNKELGNIDIYLLDQILKGAIDSKMKVLDAGCGEGRNLIYLMNNNFDVHGIDNNPSAIRMLHFVSSTLGYHDNKVRFQVASIESMSHKDGAFDYIICSAVLHFAHNEDHFFQMLDELYRVLKPGGTMFIRIASDFLPLELPQNGFPFLLGENQLAKILKKYRLEKQEPIKTVLVHKKRCMSTLVLRKSVD